MYNKCNFFREKCTLWCCDIWGFCDGGQQGYGFVRCYDLWFNPLNPEWNPICYLLALLGAHHFLHVSRIRVKSLTFRRLIVSGRAARLLRSWVRIPPGAWIFVCCECRVLSGRGLCDELITHPEESYRLSCVVVCDLETSRIGAPYIYNISCLRVNEVWKGWYMCRWRS